MDQSRGETALLLLFVVALWISGKSAATGGEAVSLAIYIQLLIVLAPKHLLPLLRCYSRLITMITESRGGKLTYASF